MIVVAGIYLTGLKVLGIGALVGVCCEGIMRIIDGDWPR